MKTIEKTAADVIDAMIGIQNQKISEDCPIGIIDMENWEWAQGVGLYGMLRFFEKTQDTKTLRYMIRWFDRHIEAGLPEKNVNTAAPMLTLAYLYEITGEQKYLDTCTEWADWIINDMPRTAFGGLQHIVSGYSNEGQLWDDTLFMTVLFLAKYGVMTQRQDCIEEGVKQFLIHVKYLFDRKTGLWFHGYTFKGNHHFAKALWARGNCWFTAGTVDFLEITGITGGVRDFLLLTLEEHVCALTKTQAQNGLWHTLLDDTDSYLETSGSAGFCYGILKGIRLGYLNGKYEATGKRALEGILKQIDKNGVVGGVSYGTGVSASLEDYKNIPLCPMTYGQALTVLALCESGRF